MVDDYFIHTILVDNVMFALEESYAFAQVAAIPWHVRQLFTASSFFRRISADVVYSMF